MSRESVQYMGYCAEVEIRMIQTLHECLFHVEKKSSNKALAWVMLVAGVAVTLTITMIGG
jgi:hypothetical protein